jgi:hypothetical protein
MDLRRISESGSYARFFFGLITMYFLVSVFAFCLIAVAYAEERPSFSDVRGEKTCGLDDATGQGYGLRCENGLADAPEPARSRARHPPALALPSSLEVSTAQDLAAKPLVTFRPRVSAQLIDHFQ